MLEKSKISFFNIDACGYYTHGQKSKVQFCDTGNMLVQLVKWSHGKSLSETQTFQSADTDGFLPVYLFDVKQSDGETLLTLWNQVPANENSIASVMANGSVGKAKVHLNELVPGSIPGFATYFWFIPDENLFANVRFQHAVSGHMPMRSYIRGFLERSSSHVVYESNDASNGKGGADLEIAGYRKDLSCPVQNNVTPRFSTSVFTKPGETDMLLQNAHNIIRVRRRTTLQLQSAEDLALWQQLWRRVRGTARPAHSDPVAVEYDIKTAVTEDEVKAIVKQWNSEDDKPTWDDFGFQLKGEQQTHWLSRAYARDSFDLDVDRRDAEVVDGESLLKELQQKRSTILKLLD